MGSVVSAARCRWAPGVLAPVVLAALACTGGCGAASFVVLEIDAPLAVPDEANALDLVVYDEGSGEGSGDAVLNVDIDLGAGDAFPQRILLEPGPERSAALVITVRALLDSTPVAMATARVDWQPGATNLVDFPDLAPL